MIGYLEAYAAAFVGAGPPRPGRDGGPGGVGRLRGRDPDRPLAGRCRRRRQRRVRPATDPGHRRGTVGRNPVGPHRRLSKPGRAAAGRRPRRRRRSGRSPDRRRAREDRPPGRGWPSAATAGCRARSMAATRCTGAGRTATSARWWRGPGPRPRSTRSRRWRAGGPTISTSGPSGTTASGWSATSRRSTAPGLRSLLTSTAARGRRRIRPDLRGPGARLRRGRGENVPEPALASHWRDGEMAPIETELDLDRAGITSVVWATGLPTRLRLAGGRRSARRRRGADPGSAASRRSTACTSSGSTGMYEAAAGTVLGCGWVAEYVADGSPRRGTAGER